METALTWLRENWQWALAFALLYLSICSLGLKVRAVARRHVMLERVVLDTARADTDAKRLAARRQADALAQVVQDADG
jgi:hypothetical protein